MNLAHTIPSTIATRVVLKWRSIVKGPLASVIAAVIVGAAFAIPFLVAGFAIPGLRWLGGVLSLSYLILASTAQLLILARLYTKTADVGNSVSLNGYLMRSGYAPAAFFVDGASATPSLQLMLVKVLALCRPRTILELGSGQTTKILTIYARESPSSEVLTLEQDATWHALLMDSVPFSANHAYRLAPLESRSVSIPDRRTTISTKWYGGADAELETHRFELILVDGPDSGGPGLQGGPYSRCGIVSQLPERLAESFVIIFDDAERYGERMTIRVVDSLLRARGVRFARFAVHGVKTQIVFCSPDCDFLATV
jgi:hypothetical protein